MPATKKILAFDLGAESGRGLLGLFDGRKLALEVLHRFPNGPAHALIQAAIASDCPECTQKGLTC